MPDSRPVGTKNSMTEWPKLLKLCIYGYFSEKIIVFPANPVGKEERSNRLVSTNSYFPMLLNESPHFAYSHLLYVVTNFTVPVK